MSLTFFVSRAWRRGSRDQSPNLFDKVLIPRTRANIRQIQLFLSDQSTAAVVRAKIAKSRAAGDAT